LSTLREAVLEEPAVRVLGEDLHRDRTLTTSIARVDEFVGGFRAAQVTLLDSDCGFSNSLLHLLAVRAISEFDEEVVWVDGGNTLDPYSMASLCKRLRLSRRGILSRVNVSRASTAYQLVTLIDERLEAEVERCAASTVIVSAVADLFLDKDMKWMESYQLLRRCADRVAGISRAHETITVVTGRSGERGRLETRLARLLYDRADVVVRMRRRGEGVLLGTPRDGRSMMFSPVPWNQATLDEFGRCDSGQDRAHIPARA
jgi:predicted ATP-dependent serine protease